jgi:UDP:flavonoid glycosyltransferase YjiC (YdhE family)
MSRVLLAWELGSNLGHLSRLLPLARRLREGGHEVLVAARNVGLATEVLSPEGIPFVQAPYVAGGKTSDGPMVSYSDVVLTQGWDSATTLWGLVQAWGNLIRLYRAAVMVLDYSPTALLAARVLRAPCVLIGTGFELPPLESPLPAFPGVTGTQAEGARRSEARVLENVNRVLDAYQAPRISALRELFQGSSRWLTTFSELDHYGPRMGESYVGPIGQLSRGEAVEWPAGYSHRILAYVRSTTPGLKEIFHSLSEVEDAAVICAAPAVAQESVAHVARPGFKIVSRPVALGTLLPHTSLFLSYAPAGSVAQALLCGVPQVLAPAHTEAQMTALRVECMGAGVVLRGTIKEPQIASALQRTLHGRDLKVRALGFARRYREVSSETAVGQIVEAIETLSSGS